MGLFDLPSPAFDWIDDGLAQALPPWARLLVWAAIGAVLSMEVYRLLSPQKRIAGLRQQVRDAQRRMAEFDGEFAEAWPHIRRTLGLALRRVGLVVPATLISALPLLVIIVWLDGRYGGTYPPPGVSIDVNVPGDRWQGRWIAAAEGGPQVEILEADGSRVAMVPVPHPVTVIHKRHWWNLLIANPAGYVPDHLPFERIKLAMPQQRFLPVGPEWMRGWEAPYFLALILFALSYKLVRRIS